MQLNLKIKQEIALSALLLLIKWLPLRSSKQAKIVKNANYLIMLTPILQGLIQK